MRSRIITKAVKLGIMASMTYLLFILLVTLSKPAPRRGPHTPPLIIHQRFHSHVIFPPNSPLMKVVSLPFLIPNRQLCLGAGKIDHLVLVHSAVGNFKRRRNFRETWANPKAVKGSVARTVFIVGRSRESAVESLLQDESSVYKDIVQGDFFDDYTNLTLKAVTGLRWVTEHCPNTDVVMKVDDDVFVDIFKATEEIFPMLKKEGKQIICSTEPKGFIFRKNDAEKLNKWKIQDEYFPGLPKYPMPFCYGFGVILSFDLVRELFELSKNTPFYRLDDVYVYGILANQIPGLIWRNEYTLFSQDANETMDVFRHKSKHGPLLLGTARSAAAMHELWDLAREMHKPRQTPVSIKSS